MCVKNIKDEESQINATVKKMSKNTRSNKIDEIVLETELLTNKQSNNAGTQTYGENTVFLKNIYKSDK